MNFYHKTLSFFALIISCFFTFNYLNAVERHEKIGKFGLKKEILEVCKSSIKFKNLSASNEFISECEYIVNMYNKSGFSYDSTQIIDNLSQEYERIRKLVKNEEPTPGFQNSEEINVSKNTNNSQSHCSDLYGCQSADGEVDWTKGYTTIEEEERKREERKKEESKLKEIEEQKRIVKLDKSYSNDEKLKLLRFFYAKEVYKYHSPDKLGISADLLALMAKHNALDCFGYAIDLAEKEWSYDDKITELNRLCYGSTNWQISEYQNLVDLIVTRNFFYPYNKKNYAIVGKVLFNFPDTVRECEKSIINLAPSKRPNHENARYIKKFYTEENERANSINWCLQRIVDGRYKIK